MINDKQHFPHNVLHPVLNFTLIPHSTVEILELVRGGWLGVDLDVLPMAKLSLVVHLTVGL